MKQIRQLISLILAMTMLCSILSAVALDAGAAEISEDFFQGNLPTMYEELSEETADFAVPLDTVQQEAMPPETLINEIVPDETEEMVALETEPATEATLPEENSIVLTESGDDLLVKDVIPGQKVLADNSDIQTFSGYPGCMPSVGTPKVLVFYITIPEGIPTWDLDLAGVEDMFFSETEESLRTFYEKSSYGKVHVEGTAYEYTTAYDVYHYKNEEMLVNEIIEYFRNTISWDDYDANNDGYIDGIYIVTKTDLMHEIMSGRSFAFNYQQSVGTVKTSCFSIIRNQDLGTLCHETCHMFGIGYDIYTGEGLNPHGSNAHSIMEDTVNGGDIPGIMKYSLGWIDNPIFLSGTGTRNINLRSVSTNGEIVIIYPNGNVENNSWLVIEYLTAEANNKHSGVRIWKTNVHLDNNENVVGLGYLEAISPFGEEKYYFKAGETITPYTYPSTSYGVTYRSVGEIWTTNTCFAEIGFSGISIDVSSTSDTSAVLTISIDNAIQDVPGSATMTFSDSSSDIIVDSSKTLIATIKSDQEMMVSGDIILSDNVSGISIPVEPVFNAYSNILYLYVSQENMDSLIAGENYLINLNDAVKTYYGSDVSIKDFSGTIPINKYGIPIHAAGPYETSFFGLPEIDFYAPDVFPIDSTHAMHFGYVDHALFMRTHNIETHQYIDTKVTVNPPQGALQIDKVLLLDGKYYAVMFRNSVEERNIRHIAVYDMEGRLIDEYTPSDTPIYVGGPDHAILITDGKAQELKVQNSQLIFETINYPSSYMSYGYKASRYKLTDALWAYVGREYVPSEHVTITLFMGSADDTFVLEYADTREVDLIYKDDKLYVLTAGEDLILHVYNSSITLVEEKVLLKHINMKNGIRDMKLGISGNSIWSSFIGTSSVNEVNYTNSYLLVFTPDMPVQYYRYGDSSSTFIGNFCYMGNGTFVMATKKPYYVLTAEMDDHICAYTTSVVAPTCTEKGYTIYTCNCGNSYAGNEVAALGHKWNSGVITKEPTETEVGNRRYTCSVCKETRNEKIPASLAVQRISGKDRVKTALSVAKTLKDTLGVEKFSAVIIATGVNEKFPDALAGSYLANVKDAPILLYNGGSSLSALNLTFIQENLRSNGTIYILGATGTIPATVEDALTDYNVLRLCGNNRYATNLAILKEAGVASADEILIATGKNFADSLSASAIGLPLLLVNGQGSSLSAEQAEFLQSVKGKKVTIIGGISSVSAELEAAIEAVMGATAERISGKARYNTSVLIAEKYFGNAESALLTYAWNFPDGLAGGPLAYAMGAPLLLTDTDKESIANEYITDNGITKGYVLGGEATVSDTTARKAFGLDVHAVIDNAYYTE